ncbi:ABC transporter permease [Actinokineospora iranica]|uniref:ABC-2 type transport system permease protein n=1 Tax=Actinokineospora iranica TaxID=1271860 RepID=A0A1G6MFP3_9PSEU|nr:ABC transporter permease [Actinokineospora iranica]SDC54064.1 ABC-2 type transport system permease protein [Actinokineospora iranica]
MTASTETAARARPATADNPSVVTLVGTELVRLRRGFPIWYAVLAPVAIAVPLYLGSLFSPEGASGQTWQVFSRVTLEFWGVLVPMTAGLTAAMSVRADQDAWRLLMSYAVPRWRYYLGKFVALSLLSLLSSTVLAVVLSGGALLNGQLGADVGLIAAAAYAPWVAGLAGTAFALVVAVRWGLGPGVTVGVAGLLAGALTADKVFWFAIPFAWPMRVILPIAGISPNGIALPAGSPLADPGVIPLALGLSVAVGTVLLALGSWHLTRKEI